MNCLWLLNGVGFPGVPVELTSAFVRGDVESNCSRSGTPRAKSVSFLSKLGNGGTSVISSFGGHANEQNFS